MAQWVKTSFKRLLAMAGTTRQSSIALGRVVGPVEMEKVKLRLLVVADASGATLQINLLRPLHSALAAGDVGIFLLTEEDEQRAAKSGCSRQQILAEAWERARPDLVFVSRYGASLTAELLQKSARERVPLVYHLDDNLFEVPVEAGIEKARKYSSPSRQQAIRRLLGEANAVYLSTERLARQLSEFCQLAPHLFVGAIASASDPIAVNRASTLKELCFGYMASSSHAADLQLALPGIIASLHAYPDLQFTVFGSLRPPPELAIFDRRVAHIPAIGDYDSFLSQLASMRWDWGLAPLRPGRFNDAKTDTKWVEYSAAGVPTIASTHPVYHDCSQGDAAVTIGDSNWAEELPNIVVDRALAERTLAAARERLIQHHGLGHMTMQLYKVFRLAGLPEESAKDMVPRIMS